MQGNCCWYRALFTRGKIKVLIVSSQKIEGVGVYVGVCGCIRTHLNNAHGVLGCEPRVGKRHLNPDGLISANMYPYKVHVCMPSIYGEAG